MHRARRELPSRSSYPSIRALLFVVGTCAGVCLAATAQPAGVGDGAGAPALTPEGPTESHALHLRARTVRTDRPIANLSELAARGPIRADRRYVLQFDGPLTREQRAALERAGVRVGEYLPSNAYIVTMDPRADLRAVRAVDFVRWGAEFDASWKLDPDIGARPFETPERIAIHAAGRALVWAHLFEGADANRAADDAMKIGGAAVHAFETTGDRVALTIELPAARVGDLTAIHDVQFVEEVPEATLRRNNLVRPAVQSGTTSATPLYKHGLTGAGQIVGVMDGRMDPNHCAFSDAVPIGPAHRKLLAYNASQSVYSNHGTHVAATVAGDGGGWNNSRGVAYGAKIVFNTYPTGSDVTNGVSLYTRLETHQTQGARVHSNSWGADFRTDYNGWTYAIDKFSHDYEDALVLFAITNQANLYTPENAKNVLAVGAAQRGVNMNNHCSGGIGPTIDGRRKPEVFAPGCSTYSAQANTACGSFADTGTSMACPAVAGAALLVRQYFTDGYYPTGVAGENAPIVPSGALLRAVLMNSAADMTGVSGYPSHREGWGRVVADDTLHFPGDSRTLLAYDVRNADPGALRTNDEHAYTFYVVDPDEQLRVTMTFTDAPAAIGASLAPVNNVDLVVRAPGGQLYRGNSFSFGESFTDGLPDAINTTEQVHVSNPEVGMWAVMICGTAVNVGTQGYALVVTGDVSLAPPPGPCPGDTNGDGIIDFTDFSTVLSQYGQSGAGLAGDLNNDGVVDFTDFSIVLANYGAACD